MAQPSTIKRNVNTYVPNSVVRSRRGEFETEAWWEEMLVQWFDVPEEEKPAEEVGGEPANSDSAPTIKSKA